MAIKFVDPNEVRYQPLDLSVIDTALTRSQERFDKANEEIRLQKVATASNPYLDPIAREQALARMDENYKNLAQQYRGRLGDAMPQVLDTVYKNTADPWLNVNKQHLVQAAAEQKLVDQYGADAIRRSNVAKQSLIDPTTGKLLSPQDARLTPNVVKAADYQQIANNLGQYLKADVKDRLLRKYKGDSEVVGYLQSGRIEELSEDKLLKLVNDPAVQEVFASMASTYQFDNRANVGYDPATGLNMFTKPLSREEAKKFNSPISKYVYGQLKQKLYKEVESQYTRDDKYWHDLASAGAAQEQRAQLDASLVEDTQDFATEELMGGYKPNFSGGKLQVASSALEPFYGKGRYYAEKAGLTSEKEQTQKMKEVQGIIGNFRTKFSIPANMTDEQVWNMYAKSQAQGRAVKNMDIPQGKQEEMRKKLEAHSSNAVVSVGGKTYRAGNKGEAQAFLDDQGITIQEFLAGYKPASIKAIGQYTGAKNTNKGGVVVGTFFGKNGEAIKASVTSDNIFVNAMYKPANQAFDAIRTLKPSAVNLGTDLKTGKQGLGVSVPYQGADGVVQAVVLPVREQGGKKVVFVGGNAIPVGSEAVSQALSAYAKGNGLTDPSQLKSSSLFEGVMTIEDLALQGHEAVWTSNKFGVSPAVSEKTLAPDKKAENIGSIDYNTQP